MAVRDAENQKVFQPPPRKTSAYASRCGVSQKAHFYHNFDCLRVSSGDVSCRSACPRKALLQTLGCIRVRVKPATITGFVSAESTDQMALDQLRFNLINQNQDLYWNCYVQSADHMSSSKHLRERLAWDRHHSWKHFDPYSRHFESTTEILFDWERELLCLKGSRDALRSFF